MYSEGRFPVTLKNALEKWLGLENPSSLAIWVTVIFFSCRSNHKTLLLPEKQRLAYFLFHQRKGIAE